MTAVGGLHWPTQKMVVMPDDPALGEHRELFAGMVGTFYEFPIPAGDDNPGFMEASEIISSRKLWDRWLEGPAPIGARVTPDRVNFSLFSRTASRVPDLSWSWWRAGSSSRTEEGR